MTKRNSRSLVSGLVPVNSLSVSRLSVSTTRCSIASEPMIATRLSTMARSAPLLFGASRSSLTTRLGSGLIKRDGELDVYVGGVTMRYATANPRAISVETAIWPERRRRTASSPEKSVGPGVRLLRGHGVVRTHHHTYARLKLPNLPPRRMHAQLCPIGVK